MASFIWHEETPQAQPIKKKIKRDAILEEKIRKASKEKSILEARARELELSISEIEARSREYHNEVGDGHRRELKDLHHQLTLEEAKTRTAKENTTGLGNRVTMLRRQYQALEGRGLEMWLVESERNYDAQNTIKAMQARLDEYKLRINSMRRRLDDNIRKEKGVLAAAKKTGGILGDTQQHEALTGSIPWRAMHIVDVITPGLCDDAVREKSTMEMNDIDPDDHEFR